MKLGRVTEFDKRNNTASKILDDYIVLENRDVIAIFQTYSQFEAIWKPDSGHIVCKAYISINSNLSSYKN